MKGRTSSTGFVSSLDAYRNSIARYPQLSAEDERALASRYRSGDQRAGARLIHACLPFVLMIAREYRCWGVPMEDIVQQGNLGLLKAAERFDPDRECRLITYAGYWVRAEIREFVVRAYRIVRLGTTKSERRALRAYRRSGETDPGKLASLSGLGREAVERLLPVLVARDASMDQPTGTGLALVDRLTSHAPSPEEQVANDDQKAKRRAEVESFLREITPRERTILRSRWMSDDPVTLEALGKRFGISKERVRQLEERTIAKLKGRLLACPGLAEAC
jgi:RNA polymerase sigma-32 factor